MSNKLHQIVAFALLCSSMEFLLPRESVAQNTFEPTAGQPGKDVVWVPTPGELVEKMLDMAKVTPQDFVMDLGSGDGRNVIAAARRGARALGVEYDPDLVELSRRLAKEAGVADRATFVQGDMYEADVSQATRPRVVSEARKPGQDAGQISGDEAWHANRAEHVSGDRLGSGRH